MYGTEILRYYIQLYNEVFIVLNFVSKIIEKLKKGQPWWQ